MKKLSLTEGAVPAVLIKYSLPLIASNVIFAITNMVDISFVMRYAGSVEGSAVGVAGQVLYVAITLMLGISVGATIAVGGCKNDRFLGATMGSIMAIVVVCSALFVGMQLLCSNILMDFMCAESEVQSIASKYIKITAIAIPFIGCNNVLLSYYYGRGNSVFPLIVFAIGGVLNILGNYVAVGVLMLGAVGSAYALIFSNIVAFLLTFVAIIIEFCKKHIVPTINYSLLKRILALALPIAILNVVATISFMSLTRFATIFAGGSVAILSAHLLAIRYNSMVVLPSRSLASGVTAVTARNLGDRDRLQDIAKYGLIYGVVFGGIMAVVTLLFSKQLIAIFGGHEVDSLIGATYLKILSIDCLVVPIVVVLFALVDGAHHTTSTMIISLLSSISRPITAYVAGAVLGLNIYGVAIAVPTASLISLAIIVPILLFIKIKDSKKKIAENSVSAIQT